MRDSSVNPMAAGMKRLILLSTLLLLAACMQPVESAGSRPEGPARIGQTVYVGGPTVRPLAVIQDSRCPTDVVCVWAGQVIVRVEIGTGQGKRQTEMTLGKPIPVADGELVLRQVTPGKRQGKAIAPGDYRFTFEFAGGL